MNGLPGVETVFQLLVMSSNWSPTPFKTLVDRSAIILEAAVLMNTHRSPVSYSGWFEALGCSIFSSVTAGARKQVVVAIRLERMCVEWV